MANLLPLINGISLVIGLLAVLLALVAGVDAYSAIFRGVVVYGAFMFAGLVFNYFYVKMSSKMNREALENTIGKLKATLTEKGFKAEDEEKTESQ